MSEVSSRSGQASLPSVKASRRSLIVLGIFVLCGSVWGGAQLIGSQRTLRSPAREGTSHRIVSLSPGVTETIEALGAAPQLVGISDYCAPPSARNLPRTGTALTPNYEAIAQLTPDVILTSEVKGAQLGPLEKLAKTRQLPWLSLTEWTNSVITLGQILNRPEEAQALQRKISTTLGVVPPQDAPRILLALDYGDTGSDETWFIRKDSIHGAALSAAGARNAIEGEVVGHPKLSPERLLEVNPDAILVLSSRPTRTRADAVAHFGKWTPLACVKNERIGVLSVPGALTVGPSVLDLVPRLKSEIASLMNGER